MSKIKIKQISSDGAPAGSVLVSDGSGVNSWAQPVLGDAEDGNYTDSRYPGGKVPAVGLSSSTKVSTAIDAINEVLGLLLPDAPSPLGGQTLSLASASTTALAASGYTTNSIAGAPSAGASVTRVTSSTINTTPITNVGDGSSGTLTAYVQGSPVGGETLTFTDSIGDTKTSGVLRVTNNTWGGTSGGNAAPDGFFEKFDTNLTGAAAVQGYNTYQIRHDVSGNTTVLGLVRDDLTANPAVSSVTVAQGSHPSSNMSSGLDHYAANDTLSVSASITNLAGETYKSGTIIGLTGPGNAVNFAAGQGGLANPLVQHMSAFALTSQTFTIGGNNQTTSGKVTVTGSNPNGSGNATHTTNLLVLSGSGGVRDTVITGPATTNRIYINNGTGDTPSDLTYSAWSSSTDLSQSAYLHEAVIAGGVIRRDVTNYSTGYLPAGQPNYSVKDANQYVTWKFSLAAKSSIAVTITGTYTGLYVALPGISDNVGISPAALGSAWWDAFTLYNGSGAPGRFGQNAGCANGVVATGTSGTVNITFGNQTSSNSTNNDVIIRIKLTGSQSISAISIA